MSYGEGWFPEPFGPEYAAPAPVPCPDCGCCSARLCETGDCLWRAAGEDRDIVRNCPCDTARLSAEAVRERKKAEAGQ